MSAKVFLLLGMMAVLLSNVPEVTGQAQCSLLQCINSVCTVNAAGVPSCQCYPGYKLLLGFTQICVDINECEATVNPCGQFRCCNTPGRYRCIQSGVCEWNNRPENRVANPFYYYLLLSRGGK